MMTAGDGTTVLTSQFPYKTNGTEGTNGLTGTGTNTTVSYSQTLKLEGSQPIAAYAVLVPNGSAFDQAVAQQTACPTWSAYPTGSNETQCSVAAYTALQAGCVPGSANHVIGNSGTLMPSAVNTWLQQESQNSAHTGVFSVSPSP